MNQITLKNDRIQVDALTCPFCGKNWHENTYTTDNLCRECFEYLRHPKGTVEEHIRNQYPKYTPDGSWYGALYTLDEIKARGYTYNLNFLKNRT